MQARQTAVLSPELWKISTQLEDGNSEGSRREVQRGQQAPNSNRQPARAKPDGKRCPLHIYGASGFLRSRSLSVITNVCARVRQTAGRSLKRAVGLQSFNRSRKGQSGESRSSAFFSVFECATCRRVRPAPTCASTSNFAAPSFAFYTTKCNLTCFP